MSQVLPFLNHYLTPWCLGAYSSWDALSQDALPMRVSAAAQDKQSEQAEEPPEDEQSKQSETLQTSIQLWQAAKQALKTSSILKLSGPKNAGKSWLLQQFGKLCLDDFVTTQPEKDLDPAEENPDSAPKSYVPCYLELNLDSMPTASGQANLIVQHVYQELSKSPHTRIQDLGKGIHDPWRLLNAFLMEKQNVSVLFLLKITSSSSPSSEKQKELWQKFYQDHVQTLLNYGHQVVLAAEAKDGFKADWQIEPFIFDDLWPFVQSKLQQIAARKSSDKIPHPELIQAYLERCPDIYPGQLSDFLKADYSSIGECLASLGQEKQDYASFIQSLEHRRQELTLQKKNKLLSDHQAEITCLIQSPQIKQIDEELISSELHLSQRSESHMILVGDAGQGKSTTLIEQEIKDAQLALGLLESGGCLIKPIPIWKMLDFAPNKSELADEVSLIGLKHIEQPVIPKLIARLDLIAYFDGFQDTAQMNESDKALRLLPVRQSLLSKLLELDINEIARNKLRLSQNQLLAYKVILSSRYYEIQKLKDLKKYEQIHLSPLDQEQLKSYLSKQTIPEEQKELIVKSALMHNPLLLNLLLQSLKPNIPSNEDLIQALDSEACLLDFVVKDQTQKAFGSENQDTQAITDWLSFICSPLGIDLEDLKGSDFTMKVPSDESDTQQIYIKQKAKTDSQVFKFSLDILKTSSYQKYGIKTIFEKLSDIHASQIESPHHSQHKHKHTKATSNSNSTICLFKKQGDQFLFWHPLFKEYFAAFWLVNQLKKKWQGEKHSLKRGLLKQWQKNFNLTKIWQFVLELLKQQGIPAKNVEKLKKQLTKYNDRFAWNGLKNNQKYLFKTFKRYLLLCPDLYFKYYWESTCEQLSLKTLKTRILASSKLIIALLVLFAVWCIWDGSSLTLLHTHLSLSLGWKVPSAQEHSVFFDNKIPLSTFDWLMELKLWFYKQLYDAELKTFLSALHILPLLLVMLISYLALMYLILKRKQYQGLLYQIGQLLKPAESNQINRYIAVRKILFKMGFSRTQFDFPQLAVIHKLLPETNTANSQTERQALEKLLQVWQRIGIPVELSMSVNRFINEIDKFVDLPKKTLWRSFFSRIFFWRKNKKYKYYADLSKLQRLDALLALWQFQDQLVEVNIVYKKINELNNKIQINMETKCRNRKIFRIFTFCLLSMFSVYFIFDLSWKSEFLQEISKELSNCNTSFTINDIPKKRFNSINTNYSEFKNKKKQAVWESFQYFFHIKKADDGSSQNLGNGTSSTGSIIQNLSKSTITIGGGSRNTDFGDLANNPWQSHSASRWVRTGTEQTIGGFDPCDHVQESQSSQNLPNGSVGFRHYLDSKIDNFINSRLGGRDYYNQYFLAIQTYLTNKITSHHNKPVLLSQDFENLLRVLLSVYAGTVFYNFDDHAALPSAEISKHQKEIKHRKYFVLIFRNIAEYFLIDAQRNTHTSQGFAVVATEMFLDLYSKQKGYENEFDTDLSKHKRVISSLINTLEQIDISQDRFIFNLELDFLEYWQINLESKNLHRYKSLLAWYGLKDSRLAYQYIIKIPLNQQSVLDTYLQAYFLIEQKQFKKALSILDAKIKKSAAVPSRLYFLKAVALFHAGKLNQAIQSIDQAIDLVDKSALGDFLDESTNVAESHISLSYPLLFEPSLYERTPYDNLPRYWRDTYLWFKALIHVKQNQPILAQASLKVFLDKYVYELIPLQKKGLKYDSMSVSSHTYPSVHTSKKLVDNKSICYNLVDALYGQFPHCGFDTLLTEAGFSLDQARNLLPDKFIEPYHLQKMIDSQKTALLSILNMDQSRQQEEEFFDKQLLPLLKGLQKDFYEHYTNQTFLQKMYEAYVFKALQTNHFTRESNWTTSDIEQTFKYPAQKVESYSKILKEFWPDKFEHKSGDKLIYVDISEDFFKGKHYEVLNVVRSALEINPKHTGTWHSLGIEGPYAGAIDEAENAFSKAIELEPKNGVSYYHRGEFYYRFRHDLKRASQDLKKGLKLLPKDERAALALWVLAEYALQHNQFQEAQNYTKQLEQIEVNKQVRIRPLLYLKALIEAKQYETQGSLEKAFKVYENYIQQDEKQDKSTPSEGRSASGIFVSYDSNIALNDLWSFENPIIRVNKAKLHKQLGQYQELQSEIEELEISANTIEQDMNSANNTDFNKPIYPYTKGYYLNQLKNMMIELKKP